MAKKKDNEYAVRRGEFGWALELMEQGKIVCRPGGAAYTCSTTNLPPVSGRSYKCPVILCRRYEGGPWESYMPNDDRKCFGASEVLAKDWYEEVR